MKYKQTEKEQMNDDFLPIEVALKNGDVTLS